MQAAKANPIAHSLFTDLMRDIKRLHSHFTAIAYPVLNREGELRTSRWRGFSEVSKPREETVEPITESVVEPVVESVVETIAQNVPTTDKPLPEAKPE